MWVHFCLCPQMERADWPHPWGIPQQIPWWEQTSSSSPLLMCQWTRTQTCGIKISHLWHARPRRHTGKHLLLDCDFGRDLGPQACVSNRHHRLLWVPVHVHVQHEAAEGGSEIVRQAVIEHAAQDQIHRKLAGDLVDGKVLAVQTHFGKQV